MLVSIIIPAYKKGETIRHNIEMIYSSLANVKWEYEIIVVVDGEVDDTYEQLAQIKKDNLVVTGYQTNQGKGFAVKYGMKKAKGKLIAFIDSGTDINPDSLAMLIEHMEWYKADIVVGSKRHLASKVKYTNLRKIYSLGYYWLVRILFGLDIKDTQTGLKVYRKEVLDHVLPRLLIKEFAFDIEMLVVAKRLGFKKIYEAPVEISLSFEDSNFGKNLLFDPVIAKMFKDTLAVFYRLNILKYYDDGNDDLWRKHSNELMSPIMITLEKITNPFFSVIIPTRRVNDFLKESFKHLKALNYKNFEVIVVLDSDEGDNLVWGEKFKKIIVGEKGPGEKRNIGANIAVGNILAFMDDDAYPAKDWLNKASEVFAKPEVYALGGPAMTPKDAAFGELLSGKLLESKLVSGKTVYRHLPMQSRLIDDYPTVNFFVRKDAFDAIGGFTTEFWPGEDTKICLDLINYFARPFLYDPSPIVFHHRRNGLVAHLKQISRYGKHRGQFTKIFPKNSRIFAFYVPSLFVLGLFAGPFFAYFINILWYPYYFVVFLYLFLMLKYTVRVFFDNFNLKLSLGIFVGIFLTHFVYGVNFIYGLIKRPDLKLKEVNLKTGNYIGG